MSFILYIIIGFLAEMIDGMLGMAYGVSCRTFLIVFKLVPTSTVSAIVHYSELPITFTTMIFHFKLKNIKKTYDSNNYIWNFWNINRH